MTATLTPPAAAVPPGVPRSGVNRFVYDAADPDVGGPIPPFACVDTVTAEGVALCYCPDEGVPRIAIVPAGVPTPLPGCHGWSVWCLDPSAATRDAFVWLVHDGSKSPRKDRGPTCPF